MWKIFAFACLSAASLAQTKHPAARLAAPMIPAYEIHFSQDSDSQVSVPYPQDFPVVARSCDEDGAPYAFVVNENGKQILRFRSGTVTTFAADKMNDIPEPRVQNYFVSGAEVFLLVKGTENASKGKIVLKNEQEKR
jgi:hypothetical protein